MISSIKKKLCLSILGLVWFLSFSPLMINRVEAAPPKFQQNFISYLKDSVFRNSKVKSDNTLRDNISYMFYPNYSGEGSGRIYGVIRTITLWMMIIFFVYAWASLLLNKKPEESKKHLYSLLYIMLWWVFVYGASRLFLDVFHFWNSIENITTEGQWLEWVTNTFIKKVAFLVLSTIKAAAFFFAIIMIAVTWFKVMAAGEWEKWKKLVKWLINVVVALLVIRLVDVIYSIAADSSNFVQNASDFIISVAIVFWSIYWVITVIMVIVAWYLYITDGWSWSNFKKASNLLTNILLSALVLFSFLLITYQIFAEFQTGGDAVDSSAEGAPLVETPPEPTTFLIIDKYYI